MKENKLKPDKRALLAVLMCTAFTLSIPCVSAEEKTEEENKDFLLEGVVVTATRTPVEEFKANANINVITAKDIEKNHWRNLSDALRMLPGVDVRNYSSAGNENMNSLYINGSPDVVVLIDGVKVNMKRDGEPPFFAALFNNLDNIERIEVLKGSASTLYGSDAKGGVIHIITKKITVNETTLRVGAGSFDTEHYSFNHAGKQDAWSWRVHYQKDIAGDFKDGRGDTQKSHANIETINLLLKREFNKNSDLTLTYDAYKAPNNEHIDFYGWAKNAFDDYNWRATYNFRFNDKTSNQLSYYYSDYNRDYYSVGYTSAAKIKTQSITDQFTRKINDTNILTAGFEYTKNQSNESWGHPDASLTNTSFYIQDEWQMTEKIKLTGGVRHDSPSEFKNNISSSFNLGYEFNPKTNMYASYNEHFITPTLSQLYHPKWGNSSMTAEKGHTFALGLNHRFNDTFVASSHFFKRNSKNKLSFVGSSVDGQWVNLPEEKADGWDIQLRKRFAQSTTFYAGYTYTNIDGLGPGNGNFVDRNVNGYIPRGVWNIGLDYSKNKLDVSLLGRGVIDKPGPTSANYYPEYSSFPSNSYWVWDIGFSYRTTPHAKIFLKINNIFDKYYAENTDVPWNGANDWYAERWYTMPGRNVYAGVQYSF